MSNKERGFTLIELLVAMVILIILLNGFMLSMLTYYDIELRNRFKKEAMQILKDITGSVESFSYSFVSRLDVKFDNAKCVNSLNRCTFEYADPNTGTILDNDGDGEPDFYDPYSGNNKSRHSAPRSGFASWMTAVPQSSGFSCSVGLPFPCVYQISNREVYAALSVARIVDDYNREVSRALGIVVWYFEPRTNKYKAFKSIVFKEKP